MLVRERIVVILYLTGKDDYFLVKISKALPIRPLKCGAWKYRFFEAIERAAICSPLSQNGQSVHEPILLH